MRTMTLEQVRDKLRQYATDSVTYYNKTGDCLECCIADDLADAIDAHLREREAGVTDEMVETSCKAAAMEWEGLFFPAAYSIEEADNLRKTMRAALEAIAPHMAGARACDHDWRMQEGEGSPTDKCLTCGVIRESKTHAPLASAQALQAWDALVEECMLTEAVTPLPDDPRKTIKDLIDWHLMADRELSNASARVPEPKWITDLRRELNLSKATHNFNFTRDEVMEMLGMLAAAPKPEKE